ncbi:Geranylgeranyl pyrophosphate synthase [Mycena venus]|uniref:Geranylgeranyl pyrophosphate synthase n=1 Tax=Mycena venus TaxID=2733690 RepID=A0A8H6YKS3_9AGAR|nr:Geranylgeranyl pyrophosphate synthase [Mycena venus]
MPAPIDTTVVPECFGRFPVKLHSEEPKIARGSAAALKKFQCFAKDSRSHSVGPYGDAYAICYPDGEMWIEALPHDVASKEHGTVKQLLDHTHNGKGPAEDAMTNVFRDVGARMTVLDPKGAPYVLGTLKQYLAEYDSSSRTFDTLEEYLSFRTLNVGFRIMVSFMQWTLNVYLTSDETELCSAFYTAAGRVMAITNDYFSWRMEKREATDRVRNAIPVVMKQYAMSESDATLFVKGVLVDAEQKTVRLGKALKGSSENIRRYVEGMEYLLGGSGFWSATCPRYNDVPADDVG